MLFPSFSPSRLTYLIAASLLIALGVAPAHAQTQDQSDFRRTPEGVVYKVVRDETLIAIARRFTGRSTDWRELARVNRISNDRAIPIGTEILIPARLLPEEVSNATLQSASGEVFVTDSKGTALALRPGTPLTEGAAIATGANGFAAVALEDGSRFNVYPNSRLTLRAVRVTRYTDTPRTSLFLERGRIESHVVPAQGKESKRFEVGSPIAISAVRGTVFRNSIQAERALNEVVEGEVTVHRADAKNLSRDKGNALKAGFGNIVEDGKIGTPVALLTAPELVGSYALQDRLPVQFDLRHPQAHAFRVTIARDAAGTETIAESAADARDGAGRVKFAELEDGTYHLRFHAVDQAGLWGQAGTAQFRLKARPFPPVLTGPHDKAQGGLPDQPARIELSWTSNPAAGAYFLRVASDQDFAHPIVERLISAEHTRADLSLEPGTYYWQVASVVTDGPVQDQGPYSDPRRLQVVPGPTAPTVEQGEGETRMSWSGQQGQTFRFQLAETPEFEAVLIDRIVTEPSTVVQGLASGTYFVRVQATDSDGFVGSYSPAQQFVIPTYWRTSDGSLLQSESGPVSPGY